MEEIEEDERAANDDEAGEGHEVHEREKQKEDVIEDASQFGEDANDDPRDYPDRALLAMKT